MKNTLCERCFVLFVFLEKKASMSVYRNVEWVGESGIFAYNLDTILLQ